MANKLPKSDYDVCVGVITSVNGVKGYVKIRSFTEHPQDIMTFKKIFDVSNKEYNINIINLKKDYVIAGIKGIDSRDEAEKLRNIRLYIKRSELPNAGQEEYYHADLLGLDAKLKDGTNFGLVKNIVNFGAGDIIEIYDLNSEKTIYYPFTKQYVPEINLEKRYIILEPLEEVLASSE
jgi:16S rRNA processing protein RimM